MTIIEQIPIWVAIGSLIVAVVSLVRTRITNTKMFELNETVAELSRTQLEVIKRDEMLRERPDIRATLVRPQKHDWRLMLVNRGDGTASNFDCQFESGQELLCSDSLDRFPMRELRSSQSVHIRLARHMSSPRRFSIKLSWKERDGKVKDYTEDMHF